MNQALRGLVVLAALFPAPAKSAEPAFSINISVVQAVVKTGSEVRLTIVLRNQIDQQIFLEISQSGERAYTINVLDSTGGPAGKTRYYRAATGDRTGRDAANPPADAGKESVMMWSGGVAGVLPGKTLTHDVSINKLYDLSQPGKYTIQVARYDELNKAVVKSNAITVTITQ